MVTKFDWLLQIKYRLTYVAGQFPCWRIPIEPGVPYLGSEEPRTGKNPKAFYKFIIEYVDVRGVN